MVKKVSKRRVKGKTLDAIAPVLADKHRLTTRQIHRIRDGLRSNDAVFSDYMFMLEGWNKLIKEVNRVSPFNPQITQN